MKHFLLFLLLAVLPASAFAHGIGGSLEKAVDGYTVDIGYQPATLSAGVPVAYDFSVLDEEGRPADFTSVWTRIVQDGKTVFAGGLERAAVGPTTLVYTYAEGGNYELSARFQNQDGAIAEASFPIEVPEEAAKEESSPFSLGSVLMGAGLGILVGFGSVLLFSNKKR